MIGMRFEWPVSGLKLPFQRLESDLGGMPDPAMTSD
jgi:hypothetical protein